MQGLLLPLWYRGAWRPFIFREQAAVIKLITWERMKLMKGLWQWDPQKREALELYEPYVGLINVQVLGIVWGKLYVQCGKLPTYSLFFQQVRMSQLEVHTYSDTWLTKGQNRKASKKHCPNLEPLVQKQTLSCLPFRGSETVRVMPVMKRFVWGSRETICLGYFLTKYDCFLSEWLK